MKGRPPGSIKKEPSLNKQKLEKYARKLVRQEGEHSRNIMKFYRHILLTYTPNNIPGRATDIKTLYGYFPDYYGAWVVVTAARHHEINQYKKQYPVLQHITMKCDAYRIRTEADRLGVKDPWKWVEFHSSKNPEVWDQSVNKRQQILNLLSEGVDPLNIEQELGVSLNTIRVYKRLYETA